jgi:hypothetical protein
VRGATGPIFEDGPSFDMAFKLFHGKDGVVPLSERSDFRSANKEADSMPVFNPLAGKAATISLSSFGLGGPFNFGDFSEKRKKPKNSESSNKKEPSSQVKTSVLVLAFPFFDRHTMLFYSGAIEYMSLNRSLSFHDMLFSTKCCQIAAI